jgi:ATP/ADP translocase
MSKSYQKSKFTLLHDWVDLRSEEVKVFALATFTLFLITASNLLFNNFAETAFLKRFGVDFLPTVILINTISAIVVMSLVGRLLQRFPGQTVLRWSLIFCTLSVALARLAIPLEMKFLYPVVYVMKTQYEILLTFLFWNLANQIFSARQSKRLFPLMVSGGILGGLCGSFSTLGFVHLGVVDNVLLAYIAGTLTAAFLVGRLVRATTPQTVKANGDSKVKTRPLFFAGLHKALPMIRSSELVRWLVVLTLIPNMIPPLLTYQISFAIDMTYTNESSMLSFFSLYRAVQLLLALTLSLFASRIYNRFGLSGGLLIHPFNHLLIFFAFMLQFDILTIVYAGISVGVLRQAIQTPGRQALNGVLPDEQRVILLPFLKGVVVRLGALIGATFVILCQGSYLVICQFPLHPQNLAAVGFSFSVLWILVSLQMKKRYPELVLGTLDWHGPERGRLKITNELVSRAREQLSIVELRLSQAVAVKKQAKNPISDLLVRHLSESAGSHAYDILRDLENEDSSRRLNIVRLALEGQDARRSANAIEVLEQLLPKKLSHDLVRGLEKNLRGGRPYHGRVLQDLASDDDKVIRGLAQQIVVGVGS